MAAGIKASADGLYGTLQVNSADVVTFNNSGNVGIGTLAPTAPLHVNSASNPQIKFGGSSAAYYWAFDREDSAGDFAITNANGGAETERMRINASGNVGIGTTSPTARLQLSSTGNPGLVFDGTNQGTDLKRIRIVTQIAAAGDFAIQSMNDAGSVKSTNLYIDASANLKFNSGYGSAATAYGCRAWVNFNGTGTVAIRASGNVSSITDNGTGDYTVNFATAMPDANYAAIPMSNSGTGSSSLRDASAQPISSSQCQVFSYVTSATASTADQSNIHVVFVR